MKKCFKVFFVVGFMSLSSCIANNEKRNYHTVVWLNYDYSLLYKDTKVDEGTVPVYVGKTPLKPSTQEYSYTFSGWSPDIVPAYVDATYVAQFSSIVNKYTVTWKDDDESVLLTEQYDYGTIPSYEQIIPDKDKDGYRYTFKNWIPNVQTITGNATYTAVYNRTAISYAITYNLNGGTNNSSNPSSYTVEDNITLKDPNKTGYTFLGWFDENNNKITTINQGKTGEISLIAHWNDGNTYTVNLNPCGGTLSETIINVQYNHPYILPAPTRSDAYFEGWRLGDEPISDSGTWTIDHNVSLVAAWTLTNKAKYGTVHEGTIEDPFDNEDAITAAKWMAANGGFPDEEFYVRGEVASFYHAPGIRQDGLVSWFLKPATEGGEKFEIYRCIGTDGKTPLTDDDIWVGGTTTAYGKFAVYRGQYETSSATFVSCEGKPQPRTTIETTFAEALAIGKALDDGADSYDYYQFDAYVTVKEGRNYYLTASKDEALVAGKSDENHGERDITGTNAIELYNVKTDAVAAKLQKNARITVKTILKNYHGQVQNLYDVDTDDIIVLEVGETW